MKPGRTIWILCIAALTIGLYPCCSVKEDRDPCPALLNLRLPPASEEVPGAFVSLTGPDGDRNSYVASLEKYTTTQASFPVTRERFPLMVATSAIEGEGVKIKKGEECPVLYIYRAKVTVRGEHATVDVKWRKEFCRLDLRIVPVNQALRLRIRGAYCGIGMDGRPLRGDFTFETSSEGSVRIPRQGDSSLMLEVIAGNGTISGDAIVRNFAIGEYLAELGYDWQASSLEDVSLEINYARSNITVRWQEWIYSFPMIVEL